MRSPGSAAALALGGLLAIASAGLGAADAAAVANAAPAAASQDRATGATALDRFLDGLHSLRAEFTEVVQDAQGHTTQRASGELLVLRPGRFRWEIHPQAEGEGGGQLLVADGRNLWFYDRDLEQVTVKPMSAALTATPAMLLSGGPGALSAFNVSDAGARDGLEWVRVTPKAADADFREARLGFSGNQLRRMVLQDELGETATFDFRRAARNAPVAVSQVSFTPPAGADVIGTAEK